MSYNNIYIYIYIYVFIYIYNKGDKGIYYFVKDVGLLWMKQGMVPSNAKFTTE